MEVFFNFSSLGCLEQIQPNFENHFCIAKTFTIRNYEKMRLLVLKENYSRSKFKAMKS